jgi:hypothetical protein
MTVALIPTEGSGEPIHASDQSVQRIRFRSSFIDDAFYNLFVYICLYGLVTLWHAVCYEKHRATLH